MPWRPLPPRHPPPHTFQRLDGELARRRRRGRPARPGQGRGPGRGRHGGRPLRRGEGGGGRRGRLVTRRGPCVRAVGGRRRGGGAGWRGRRCRPRGGRRRGAEAGVKEGEAHGGDRAAALAWPAAEARSRSAGPAAAMLTACGHAKAWIKSCAPGKGEATRARLVHPDPPPASLAVAGAGTRMGNPPGAYPSGRDAAPRDGRVIEGGGPCAAPGT